MAATHELIFNGLDLIRGTGLSTNAVNADFGNPESVDKAFTSSLLDGDYVTHLRDGNRELHFQVEVTAATEQELATIEENELAIRLYKRGTLVWKPPTTGAAYNVYDILSSKMEFAFDDLDELRLVRTFNLTLVCAPYVRPVDPVTSAALPAPTPVADQVIADGTSTTGWSISGTGTITSVASGIAAYGNVLRVDSGGTSNATNDGPALGWSVSSYVTATKTLASLNFTATPYLHIDIAAYSLINIASLGGFDATSFIKNVRLDGVLLPLVSKTVSPLDPTWQRYTFITQDPSATSLTYDVGAARYGGTPDPTGHAISAVTDFDVVVASSTAPSGSSGRSDGIRSFDITGSMRTPGSFLVTSPTASNDVIVYSYGSADTAYDPTLRRWRVGGTSTPNTSMISGSTIPIGSGVGDTYLIPISNLPRGGYQLLLRMQNTSGSGTMTLNWTARTIPGASSGGSAVGPTLSGTSDVVAMTSTTVLLTLGSVFLLPTDVPEESLGWVKLTLGYTTVTGTNTSPFIDQGWFFWQGGDNPGTDGPTDAALTVARDVKKYFWIDSPDLSNKGVPAVYTGSLVDRSDAYHAGSLCEPFAIHPFVPPNPQVYVASMPHTNTTAGAVDLSFEFYPRFRHNVVD